jgi:hypothetical protein
LSLDESIGKIEVDPKEQASVVEVFQDITFSLTKKNWRVDGEYLI